MLSTRRARLFTHFLHPRPSIKWSSSAAPCLCRYLSTGNRLLKSPYNNGSHGPVYKTEGHPIAHHTLCRDAPLQAFPVKKEGCDGAQPNVCIQSFVKPSAFSISRKKGYSSHGDVGVVDATGHPSLGVKVSESNAKLSKASRRKAHARSKEVKAKASRETLFLSYGDAKVSESEACNQDVAGLFRELERKVELLEAEKMSVEDVARLFKSRAFRSVSFEHLSALLQVLKEFFGTGEGACQALARSSFFLLHPVELLQQTLQVLTDFHINKEAASRIFICSYPPLYVKVELLRSRLLFLSQFGFTVQAINRMCRRHPKILRSPVSNMLRNIEFLDRIGITKERLLKVLQKRPRVLSCSVDDNLILKGEYLQQLGFSGEKLFAAMYEVLIRSFKNLQAHVQSIKDLGFSDEDVQSMITLHPSLLALSIQNLKAKFNFLVHEQNRDIAEIVKRPVCLLYSLHGRIIPRFKCIEKLGRSKVYTLSTILSCSDVRFRKQFRAAV